MAFAPWQLAVLKRYGLVDANGNLTQALLTSLGDDKPGSKVDPEVLKRLFTADSTAAHVWAGLGKDGHSWVFYQAGGGDSAVKQSEQALSYLKQRFINHYDEDKWAEHEPKFRDELFSADQDVCQKMRGSFGFFRNWPGRNSDYEHVTVQLTNFLKQYRKLLEMNKDVPEAARQPYTPETIESWQKMEEVNKKVANWIAAKRVRTDYRLAQHRQEDWIYNDDYVLALAPLTYAAAVKYGFSEWDISDPEKFAQVSQGDLERNPWDTFTNRGNMVVVVEFHVPMPRWIKQKAGHEYSSYTLNNLLFSLTKDVVNQNPDNWMAQDEEGHDLSVAQVKQIIRWEATRGQGNIPANAPTVNQRHGRDHTPHPTFTEPQDQPIKRGANVVADQKEAEEIISHFNQCLDEIQRWAKNFRGSLARVQPETLRR